MRSVWSARRTCSKPSRRRCSARGRRLLTCRSNRIFQRRNAIPVGGLSRMTAASEYFPPRLRGQVAVITGAARGLGRAYALRLARLGADIVINDINLASAADVNETLTADTVMDEIRQLGRQALGITADVTSEADVQRLFDEIFATFPQINILVNNAGGGRGGNSVRVFCRRLGRHYQQKSALDFSLLSRRGAAYARASQRQDYQRLVSRRVASPDACAGSLCCGQGRHYSVDPCPRPGIGTLRRERQCHCAGLCDDGELDEWSRQDPGG